MKPLGFVIITYNRPDDMLALARNIASLDRASELLEEVVVVNNRSTADYGDAERFMASCSHIPFRYILSDENLGVSRGRNFAIRQGRAPVVVMIDDDAEMEGRGCLTALMEEFARPTGGRPRAVVSFKVLYHSTRVLQESAFPHKRPGRMRGLPAFETYYFAGGAHAVLREAIERVGLYPEDFFYGMEEYDLSYRLLEAGYSIAYSGRVVMLHKESPLGRPPAAEKLRMMWVNKSKVAWRHLPAAYFVTTALMWSLQYLRTTGFDVGGWWRGWRQVLRIPSVEDRRPVGVSTMSYLRAVGARLWY